MEKKNKRKERHLDNEQREFGWDDLTVEEQADFAGIHEETKWALQEEKEEIMNAHGVERFDELPEDAQQELLSRELEWSSEYGASGSYVQSLINKHRIAEKQSDEKSDHTNTEPDIKTLRIWDAEERRVADEVLAQEWLNEMCGQYNRPPDFDDLNYSDPDIADQFDDIED